MYIAGQSWRKDNMNPKRTARYYCLKFTRLKGDPQSLAGGTAIGVFFGTMPIIPFHTISVLLVTFLTRKSTIAGMLASVVVCNPLTYFPQYYLPLLIGNAITPYSINWERIKELLTVLLTGSGITERIEILGHLGYEATIVLIIGGLVISTPLSIGSYIVSLRFFSNLQEQRRKRHILN